MKDLSYLVANKNIAWDVYSSNLGDSFLFNQSPKAEYTLSSSTDLLPDRTAVHLAFVLCVPEMVWRF